MEVAVDEDAISHVKGMHHKQEDDAVKHGCNGTLEDEAEGHNGSCYSCPQMSHIHLNTTSTGEDFNPVLLLCSWLEVIDFSTGGQSKSVLVL